MRAQPVIETKLPRPISDLIEALRQNSSLDAAQATEMLGGLELRAADLGPWCDFDHPVGESYGRVLLDQGPNFELMLMSWAPGDYSAIHDHGEAEWGAVRYFGHADHVLFSVRDDCLSLDSRMTMQPDDVFAVDHSLIHLMGNPTDFPFVSLHLYGRDQAAPTITGGARIFDLYEERIQRTDGGVFFCLPESTITAREPCPRADTPTKRLHHDLMLRRIEKMQAHGKTTDASLSERARRLRSELGELD